eukprot:GHRR01030720.1.p1 GENE.GHRR01030720.1~~GHRR01030720.1.p1  ORF type:complete len:128 (-),score=21.82 GHRR01030720.1:121-504(-)
MPINKCAPITLANAATLLMYCLYPLPMASLHMQAVFGAYGIGVDPRHLGLIADFMTHQGGYRACNRLGIDSEISPLLKMSFETAAKFLMEAALMGGCDNLASLAARLVVGQVAEVGTGCCKVLHMVT